MIKIIYLGGRQNGKPGSSATGMNKQMDWIKENRGADYEVIKLPFQTITNEIPYLEEYYFKVIKKGNELKAFYILKDLSVEEIKKLSEEFWEQTYTLGYEFD
ncbi:hypothetical protein D7V64_02715 [Acinetobacter cumulans]|uniref:Uncharacterized protein n=1 Tax=Acinetobacter cumulans TaxID=2136182 RepID=A0A3A8GJK3_9GAMM|nr:hypothetical protein [Acinetobacter cumulans]RKG55244.1 hypothetical protein D7V64_02715 [Acinetobacter cumulans]